MTNAQESAAMPSFAKIGAIIPQIIEYLPLLGILQSLNSAVTLDAKAAAVMGVLRFIAERTSTPLDNEFIAMLEPCLKTQAGMDFLMWIVQRAQAIADGDRLARQMPQGA